MASQIKICQNDLDGLLQTILASLEKSSSKRSWVWEHVTKCIVSELQEVENDGKKEMVEVQVLKAKCNHCNTLFACDTSGVELVLTVNTSIDIARCINQLISCKRF